MDLVSRLSRIYRADRKIHPNKRPTEVPLDETRVEFDEDKIDRIGSDVRDEVHLNVCHETRGKYEQEAG
jgi:hypothetical protein